MSVVVTFVGGPKVSGATKSNIVCKIALSIVPRIGESISLPLSRGAGPMDYQVMDVHHIIEETGEHQVIVAIEC